MTVIKGLSDLAINGVVKRKIWDWLSSIEDEALRVYLLDKIIVSGGAIASMKMGIRVNDYDVYFTERDAAVRVTNYYLKRFAANPPRHLSGEAVRMYVDPRFQDRVRICIKSVGVASAEGDESSYQYFESAPQQQGIDYANKVTEGLAQDSDEQRLLNQVYENAETSTETEGSDLNDPGNPSAGNEDFVALVESTMAQDTPPALKGPGAKEKNRYRPVFMSSNAITLSDQIQLCVRFYGSPEDIQKNFDFVHCTGYWESSSSGMKLAGKVSISPEALDSMLTRTLRYVGSRYPFCSAFRAIKFSKRGWTVPSAVFVKIGWQIHKLNLDDVNVWEDQLTGVDTAFYAQIISILRSEEAAGRKIDGEYVIALIDRMM